jgi:hypothetical protein
MTRKMTRICTIGVAVAASFTLLQQAEAGSRGASHSSSSGSNFSGARSSATTQHYAGPGRSYSNGPRFNGPVRFSATPAFHNRNYTVSGSRSFTTAPLRNPAYFSNRTRFSGDRTTAFNAQTSSRATARLAAGRTAGTRAQPNNNRERVVASHSANWRRNWDRSRDHWWHGRRCHFHNNLWVIYEPFFWDPYLYGDGYYPYGGYYDGGYSYNGYDESAYYDNGSYNNSYAPNEYSPSEDSNQQQSQTDSRVGDVQSALARTGYYDGPIDGRLGETTRKALRRYQRDRGLKVTGSIDQGVIEALRLR